jgi:hypothetical protein
MLRHYGAPNPLELHDFVSPPPLAPPELVVERAPLSSGQFIITYGRVLASNVLEATKGPYRSVMVQLIPAGLHVPPRPSEEDPVIYCRVPLEEVIVPANATVFAEGIVVASGTAQTNQGGLRRAVYMDCAAIAPPDGRCGHFPLPPLPEALSTAGRRYGRRQQLTCGRYRGRSDGRCGRYSRASAAMCHEDRPRGSRRSESWFQYAPAEPITRPVVDRPRAVGAPWRLVSKAR